MRGVSDTCLLLHVVGAPEHQAGGDQLQQTGGGEAAADGAADQADDNDGQGDGGQYEHGLDLGGVLRCANAEDTRDQRQRAAADHADDEGVDNGRGIGRAGLLYEGLSAHGALADKADEEWDWRREMEDLRF